ncbi:MAG TPA: hypothetical protein VFG52_10125 [Xanthomonadales bacterium]|nr:hypothetical protein [Xanthomonadales bacterium]
MKFSENTRSRWAAYFGGATVVASLLLVSWEIRQNTVALSAQALQDLNSMANEILLAAAENGQLSEVLEKGNQDISSLTGAEYQQYWGYNYALMNSLDAAYGFYQRGILSEEDYSGWRTYTCQYLRGQSVREIWNRDKATFGNDFAVHVARECNL